MIKLYKFSELYWPKSKKVKSTKLNINGIFSKIYNEFHFLWTWLMEMASYWYTVANDFGAFWIETDYKIARNGIEVIAT